MKFKQIEKRALDIREMYDELNRRNGLKIMGVSERLQGLVGDIGDLTKLIMAKQNFRNGHGNSEELNTKLAHELGGCLWSIIAISKSCDIDLEKAFLITMMELEERIRS